MWDSDSILINRNSSWGTVSFQNDKKVEINSAINVFPNKRFLWYRVASQHFNYVNMCIYRDAPYIIDIQNVFKSDMKTNQNDENWYEVYIIEKTRHK